MATILHSLQHSHDDAQWFTKCLEVIDDKHGIVLLEDAVNISCHLPSLSQLNSLSLKLTIYVLDVDLKARGLTAQLNELIDIRLAKNIELISYQEFVELTLEYDKLVNWA